MTQRLPVLRAADVAQSADPVKLALIGDPVEHSASPGFTAPFSTNAEIDGSYVATARAFGGAPRRDPALCIRRIHSAATSRIR